MRSVLGGGEEEEDEEGGVLPAVVESERVVVAVVVVVFVKAVKAAVERTEARGRWRIFLNMNMVVK